MNHTSLVIDLRSLEFRRRNSEKFSRDFSRHVTSVFLSYALEPIRGDDGCGALAAACADLSSRVI